MYLTRTLLEIVKVFLVLTELTALKGSAPNDVVHSC